MMRSRFLVSVIVVPSLYLASACGGDVANPWLNSACAHYVKGMVGNSCGAPFPDDDIKRLQQRFEKGCEEAMTLPGSVVTEASLEACAVALWKFCSPDKVPEECVFRGTLPPGADCTWGHQCTSGGCSVEAKCTTPGGKGAVCDWNRPCADGLACDYALGAQGTCFVPTEREDGASCSGATDQCAGALRCTGAETCAAPSRSSAEDEACADTWDCAPGLNCVSQKCAHITWSSAGAACNIEAAPCLVGYCDDSSGDFVCPRILPDGSPCSPDSTQKTCDSFAGCVGGVCTMSYDLGWARTRD